MDSWGDSWSGGSWLEVQNINGNVVYKGYLVESREESITISLYQPITTASSWKFISGTVTGNWYESSFSDSTWTTETLGSSTTVTSGGPQYFRKTFSGLADMAAYELSMKYKYGIVVYMNGIEVYRDNMPDGAISSSSVATGSYTTLEYRSYIRPGNDVANSNCLIAIELHFPTGTQQTNIDFDASLAIYAKTNDVSNCYAYPYDATVSGVSTATNAYDWNKFSYVYTTTTGTNTLTATLNNNHVPYVNGMRFFPYTYQANGPSGYTFAGAINVGSTYQNILSSSSRTYSANTFDIKTTLFSGRFSRVVQFSITSSSSGSTLYIPEFTPVVCNLGSSSQITFAESSYTYYGIYEQVEIKPLVDEFTNCNILPQVPAGLTFNQQTCTVSGIATEASPVTVYTMTSVAGGVTYTGTFSLTITMCSGSILDIRRITKTNTYAEGYTITDITTNQVINSQSLNGELADNIDIHTIVCCTGTKYRISMEGALNYWYPYSFVFLYLVLGQNENEMIGRYHLDNILGIPTSYVFNTHYEVTPVSTWYYKMSEVPSDWYGTSTSGWTEGNANTFTTPTNRFQFYKKTVTIGSLENVAGFTLSLRFKYGCVVYINNNEVYRYGVSGTTIDSNTYASTSYTDVFFRSITLPIATIAIDASNPSKTYLQTGSNVVAIALIAQNDQQTTVNFDAALRLLGDAHVNRVFLHSGTGTGVSYNQQITDPFHGHHLRQAYSTTCTSNYLEINFVDDRKEWISSIVLQNWYEKNEENVGQFTVMAKNDDMTDYVTLKEVTGLKWSYAAQEKRIWIHNNKPYNRYRLKDFGTGNSANCAWRINRIAMYSDTLTAQPPALSYTPSISVFKDVEMAEVYPSSNLYSDFTVNPALPNGITIDTATGMISGTAHQQTSPTTYTVTARKYNSYETVTTTFSLEVTVCTGGKSLITMTVRTDSYPSQAAYKLHQGKGYSGTVVSELAGFPRSNNLYYADFCLNHAIYTMETIANSADGWLQPAGFMFTVDIGTMRFEMGQVPAGTPPIRVSSMFSSFLPFQIEYDDWKVYKEVSTVDSNWNSETYDDSAWLTTKASQIGTTEAITVYARRSFTIDDISNYQVLNIRIKYAGGIVAFFNGRKVARFNLADEYTSQTESIAIHDSTLFSKFHVILSTVGAKTGTNVMAFEIHRPYHQSSSADVVFDATGVFGVNDCNIVVDTFATLEGSTPYSATLEELWELNPVVSGYQSNAVGTYMEWVVENLEGTKFNSFGMHVPQDVSNYGFSVYSYSELEGTDRTSILAEVSQVLPNRQRKAYDVPVGIAGFRRFRYEVDASATTNVYITSYLTQYCKASGTGSCPGIEDYPAVGEGQISPGVCPEGFRGYTYRTCSNGQLGEVKNEHCTYKIPAFLSYPQAKYSFVKDTEVQSDLPDYLNIITRFYLDDGILLPEGLQLDEKTGRIYGKPTSEMSIRTYTIYGSNPTGVTFTTVNINIRIGECKTEGLFNGVKVGETSTYECSMKGSYIGSQSRACVLGAKDGEWQKASGMCISTMVLTIIIVVVIIIIIVVILFIKKSSSKKTATAGAKNKKPVKKAVKKADGKKPAAAKTVKV